MGRVALFCAAFFVGVLLCVPARAGQSRHKSHKIPVKQQATQPEVAAPAPPPAPLTLEHMPATPAQVTYQNSQLTILARNSTVGDILRAVHKQTGANVDAPPNATQRVVGQFGPGSPRDVLASVLDASGFNYVLLGSPTNPNGLEHVIITAKSNEPITNAAVNTPPQPAADADAGNDASDANDAQEPEQGAPSESFVPQDNPPTDNSPQDDDNSQDQSQNPQIKTPEQLLQELQRQQLLQQQQQQQNQNQPQPGPTEQMHQIQR